MTNVKYTNSARYKCLEYLKKDSVDLYLCYCGLQICVPGHSYGPETRTEYLIHIILSGEGSYTVGNKTYQLGPNTAFLIYPGISTYYEASKDNPWTYIWVGFNGAKAALTLKHAHFTQDNLVIPIKDVVPFTNYVNGMLASSQLTYANDLAREGYLYQFVSSLIKEQYSQENIAEIHDYPYQIYVDHTLEYIEHNYQKNIKVQTIADYIGINRSYLANCFKSILHMSPKEYIINYRMNQASLLLKNSDLTITEIAENVGYDDSFNFSKAFKKVFGISPTNYRNASDNLDVSDKDSQNRI
jgi:AraC family transcriptional regulator of arabinose operon